MDNGGNRYLFLFDAVNNPVTECKMLSERTISQLRHNTSGKWKLGQQSGYTDDLRYDCSRVKRRIPFNVLGNRFNIGQRLRRPCYSVNHLLRRATASSCE